MPGHHIEFYVADMSEIQPSTGKGSRPCRYQIRLQGHLDARWEAWFDGLVLNQDSDGTSVLSGPVVDQAALHGLLHKVRDTGLSLLSVVRIDPGDSHNSPPTQGETL
jgi:hypothetical protein